MLTRRRFVVLAFAALLLAPQLQADVPQLPQLYNFNCRQGETFTRVITWCVGTVAQCNAGTGTLVNLTGFTAKLQLRDTMTGIVLDEFTDTTGLTLGGTLGTITWTMTASETALYPVGTLAYDLRLTSSGGTVTYLLYGHVSVHARVTQ